MKLTLPVALLVFFLLTSGAQVLAQSGDDPAPRPTPDRLAEPTLPANPAPADLGAQAYWLSCMPCHGDKGQGLTEEFRQLYPVEEQNCWASGCHGVRHYQNGWTLPERVPALIGPGALSKFDNETALFGFIRATMPFSSPGSLDEETYRQVIAFMVRQNQLETGQELFREPDTPEIQNSTSLFQDQGLPYLAAILVLVLLPLAWVLARYFRRSGQPPG